MLLHPSHLPAHVPQALSLALTQKDTNKMILVPAKMKLENQTYSSLPFPDPSRLVSQPMALPDIHAPHLSSSVSKSSEVMILFIFEASCCLLSLLAPCHPTLLSNLSPGCQTPAFQLRRQLRNPGELAGPVPLFLRASFCTGPDLRNATPPLLSHCFIRVFLHSSSISLEPAFPLHFKRKNNPPSLLVCTFFTRSPHDVSTAEGMNLERPRARSCPNCGPKKATKSHENSYKASLQRPTSQVPPPLHPACPWCLVVGNPGHGAGLWGLCHPDLCCPPAGHLPDAVPGKPQTWLCSYRQPSSGSSFSRQSSTASINLPLRVVTLSTTQDSCQDMLRDRPLLRNSFFPILVEQPRDLLTSETRSKTYRFPQALDEGWEDYSIP